jgi:hypothetical protein
MNRPRFALALVAVLMIGGVSKTAVYDNIYWVGGSGEWSGDRTAPIPYSTGHWSTDPNAVSGLPAKLVLGRTDGIRVNSNVGAGTYDHDRLPCDTGNVPCTGTLSGGTQLGTDIFINTPVTVSYNPNRKVLADDPRSPPDNNDRFTDWRIQPNSAFPGTPTLNLSNGARFEHITSLGGDSDGMWTRWNGAALNIDDATFHRAGDPGNGFSGGAFMFASYHGYANSVQTVSITNGGRFENDGQVWFGQSQAYFQEPENFQGIRVVVTINDGVMDLTGGDQWELDNDGLPLRADLSFVYAHKADLDPSNDELFVINFTGPGSIIVDGDAVNSLDGDTSTGGGGIRIIDDLSDSGVPDLEEDPSGNTTFSAYGADKNTQASYQDLWNYGILRAHGLSGPAELGGANFNDYFSVSGTPGSNNYTLTSNVVAGPDVIPGDYNRDGIVDAADYIVYRKGDMLADGNGSLHIDPADELIWRENFGRNSLGASDSPVPEPGTVLLMVLGLASLSIFRKRLS